MFKWRPVPSSSPARWVRRGMTSIRQQNASVPCGAVRIHRLSGGVGPSPRPRRASPPRGGGGGGGPLVGGARAGGPVVLDPRSRCARGEHELVGQPPAVRGEEHGL